ncbi:DUF1254 domain-containing protein [Pinibacter aurantiacus]|uniref:DUF1254 domain-containing protein n=1 Tax=Pinibacter aurantiacus TaxID=2851599 RepID=A0A9E2W8U6_9BACT|nr:DUF1254 domain-containing protein [Pinibacter aurantiacus]MBV4359041.1 DUF1254 domain-containing protein [Pinibacter aurantiacus]
MYKKILLIVLPVIMCSCNQNSNKQATTTAATIADSSTPNQTSRVLPPSPDSTTKITVEYARLVAKDAYFWAWPMVNIYNRRLAFSQVKEIVMSGPLIQAPLNQFGLLTDYVIPTERAIACPNQDVVYGIGALALDLSPVVIQVPDFGKRFWVYQIVDLRTDGFVQLGQMYDTKPGFYLLVGPNWNGKVPGGIAKVFRSSSNTGIVGPRIFMDDTPEDRAAIQPVLQSVVMYPLSDFDGKMKKKDWKNVKTLPAASMGNQEMSWVFPDKFFDELPIVLADAPPMPGEEARYAQVLAVIAAARKDPAIKKAMIEAAAEVEAQVIKPLFEFRNFGRQLPFYWSTINNGAAFGTDYFTRTATAKSNILVNKEKEAKYFYQDRDSAGIRLNSANKYEITFTKENMPPVNGFWSLTLYNQHHFFELNNLNRYSLGTKNKSMKTNSDGSLTIYVQSAPPAKEYESNWLPAVEKGEFSLYLRTYWPKEEVLDGRWMPPAVSKIK